MKFPEVFSKLNPESLEKGRGIVGCFGDDGKEYTFDYTQVPESEKLNGETPADTLTRLANANEAVANIEIDVYNTLWPESRPGGITLLAGWKKNAEFNNVAWRPSPRWKPGRTRSTCSSFAVVPLPTCRCSLRSTPPC